MLRADPPEEGRSGALLKESELSFFSLMIFAAPAQAFSFLPCHFMRGHTTLTLLFFGKLHIQPPLPLNLRSGLQGQGMVLSCSCCFYFTPGFKNCLFKAGLGSSYGRAPGSQPQGCWFKSR